jgi:hypothetical protein
LALAVEAVAAEAFPAAALGWAALAVIMVVVAAALDTEPAPALVDLARKASLF